MTLTFVDWLVIAGYFALNLAIGLYYARRARGSTSEFFLSGRNVPWWLAGTSMVATTFAADTPLAVTGMVARNGIAGNWLWWNMATSGMLTVFFYARLWRRAGVMTDVEFAELRYSGKPAAFLRGFRALYLGHADQLHHHRLGQSRDDEDPRRSRSGLDARGALWALIGDAGLHRVLHDDLRPVGRAGHRLLSVRPQDGHGDRARRTSRSARSAGSRR